jgi:hypothetical protein
MLKKLGLDNHNDSDIDELFNLIDTDRDYLISLDEF